MKRKGGSDESKLPERALASIKFRKGKGRSAPAPLRKVLRSIFQLRPILFNFREFSLSKRQAVCNLDEQLLPSCVFEGYLAGDFLDNRLVAPSEFPAEGIGKKLRGKVANDLLALFRQKDALEALKILEFLTAR